MAIGRARPPASQLVKERKLMAKDKTLAGQFNIQITPATWKKVTSAIASEVAIFESLTDGSPLDKCQEATGNLFAAMLRFELEWNKKYGDTYS
jgi:hypothetical protein